MQASIGHPGTIWYLGRHTFSTHMHASQLSVLASTVCWLHGTFSPLRKLLGTASVDENSSMAQQRVLKDSGAPCSWLQAFVAWAVEFSLPTCSACSLPSSMFSDMCAEENCWKKACNWSTNYAGYDEERIPPALPRIPSDGQRWFLWSVPTDSTLKKKSASQRTAI